MFLGRYMSDNQENELPEGKVEGTINAVTGLIKAVPVYEDAIQPIAKETGKALQTVGKAVNAALLPIRGLVWGIEQIESFVHTKVAKKLENIPVENIQTPDPAIAGPALESLRYTGHKESLSELYANLLASSMDSETAKNAHPGFVEIIRNLSADEAKTLTFLFAKGVAPIIDIRREEKTGSSGVNLHELVCTIGSDSGCEHRDLIGSYLINLERLGLIELDKGRFLSAADAYTRITDDPAVKAIIEALNASTDFKAEVVKYFTKLTPFGRQFGQACIVSKG
jgi:hypothetical protein